MTVLLLGLLTALIGAVVISLGHAGNDSAVGLALKVLLVILPLIAAILSAILGRLNLAKRWVAFRAGAETLKSEAFLFATTSDPYSGSDRETVLEQRVRAIKADLAEQAGVAAREGA